jgi:hypothetical protein
MIDILAEILCSRYHISAAGIDDRHSLYSRQRCSAAGIEALHAAVFRQKNFSTPNKKRGLLP